MKTVERILKLEKEIEICLDEGDFDTAAFLSIRILKILSEKQP